MIRELITVSRGLSRTKSAEFKAGIRSLSFLVDHGFQDMVVLPGSLFIQVASLLHEEIFKKPAMTLRNIRFQNPVILSDEDIVLKVKIRENSGRPVEYAFFEPRSGENTGQIGTGYFAKLEIELPEIAQAKPANEFSIDEIKARATEVISGKEFYRKLRENGNQYGPRFQNLSAIWRSENQIFGKLATPVHHGEDEEHGLDPVLVDSITQLAAAFLIEERNTVILKSIDRIEIRDINFTKALWACATRRKAPNAEAKQFVDEIDAFDESGKLYLKFSGVSFAHLPRAEATVVETNAPLHLCIASSFTAEPLEDSLKFWGNRFGIPTRVQFAAYNQIVQQLLGADGAFRKNSDGVNAILLYLGDWISKDRQAGLKIDRERVEKSLRGSLRCMLPNGLDIAHLNWAETDYLYQEIFRDQCYLRHGIRLNDGDTIIDIGANIGLFSLFAANYRQNLTTYAFEPNPVAYKLLKRNCKAYGINVHAFQWGVSNRKGMAKFTFYENSSVFSGFHPDTSEDRKAIETVVRNMLSPGTSGRDESLEEYVAKVTADKLRNRTFECRLTSVSDVIQENRIKRVHLLKIDAERSELEIVEGIDSNHWPLIDQIVIEVHDRTRQTLTRVERLLCDKGYRCAIEHEKLLENSGLFTIYATRAENLQRSSAATTSAHNNNYSLKRNVDEFCAALNSFMAHSRTPMLLCVCPHSPETGHQAEVAAAEQELLSIVGKIENVHPISSQAILRSYPFPEYYDPHTYDLGHIPYTSEGYAAIGTTVFRTLVNLQSSPLKVIALDCDDTLWEGVCGEEGPAGVQITDKHRLLQEFVSEQAKRGLLICLCSKNNEKDVFDVFDQRKKMLLGREQLASWRINWNKKSDNLKSLAEELNLGLDSFVFIDNDPVDCAEVRSNCPEVLTLQLPRQSEMFHTFLNGIWGLGSTPLTAEDHRRTKLYQDNRRREQFRAQTISLKDFLNGLQLRIRLTEPTANELKRVSQLTFRTSQFNFTTIRRTEDEIRNWLRKGDRRCLVANVSDRFGDYGLVGVLLYERAENELLVDTFLLSCRVLGRGVEHYLLSELARKAGQDGIKFVRLTYVRRENNLPALEFINSLHVDLKNDETGALSVTLPTEQLMRLRYEPDQITHPRSRERSKRILRKSQHQSMKWFDHFDRSVTFQKICDELYDMKRIAAAVAASRGKSAGIAIEIDPGDTLETAVAKLWKRVLGRRQIGIHDNFFDLGGTSLKAVQLIALIQKELGKNLSVTSLFECPTIRLMARKLAGASGGSGDWSGAMDAQLRGRRRRYPRVRRKAA